MSGITRTRRGTRDIAQSASSDVGPDRFSRTHKYSSWLGTISCTRLSPLSKSDSENLANYFFTGLSNVPAEITQHLYERSKVARGHQSLIQYLREAGAIVEQNGTFIIDETVCWELEWPDDLEGVVLARLNMLSPRDRLILGHAGVVGRVFWIGALVAIERRHVAIPQEIGSTGRDNLTWEINRALERLEAMRFVTRVESKILGEETWRLFQATS